MVLLVGDWGQASDDVDDDDVSAAVVVAVAVSRNQ